MIHRDADSKFWADVEAQETSLKRRRERKGATTASSCKSRRISSQPHRYAPLDFVTTHQASSRGSEKKGERKKEHRGNSPFPVAVRVSASCADVVLAAGLLPAL